MKALKLKGDKVIWMLVVFFAMVSILAVFSSSTFLANKDGVDKISIFFEQIKFVAAGFAILVICYLIPLGVYRKFAFAAFAISLALLVLTFIPSFQVKMNGAIRGIKLFGKTIQVFEFAKVGLILYLARALERWEDRLDNLKDFSLRLLLPVGAVCALIIPNSFSSALLFAFISFLLMWFMDVKFKYLLFSAGVFVAILLMMFTIYNAFYAGKEPVPGKEQGKVEQIFNRFGTVQHRMVSYVKERGSSKEAEEKTLTPEQKQAELDNIRQSENAKVAISEGGLIGKGPGKSTQRYSLSMAFSDFIFAFIVEEYGLLGGFVVIMLYTIFLFRCIRIGSHCRATFSGAVVIGLAFLIAIQAMLHIYVNVRLLPITGHTLPLISHGGTAFVVLSGAFGIILSVSKQVDKQNEEDRLAAKAEAEAEAGNGESNIEENY